MLRLFKSRSSSPLSRADDSALRKTLGATIFKLAIRKRGPVRLPGLRRTFARRADVERLLEGSGALR